MSQMVLEAFVSGALAMAYLVAGVFFLRFWRRTRDGLFLAFALAFWLMSANYLVPTLLGVVQDQHGELYLIRLAAFALIILAVAAKNARSRR